MYIDKLLTFSDGQALTATANASNDVDQLAKGSAMDGNQPWIVARCGTLLDSAGEAAVLKIALTHDSAVGFGTVADALAVTIAEASIVANSVIWAAPLPPRLKRYLRVTYTVTGENFTSGTIDCFIVPNIDVLLNRY